MQIRCRKPFEKKLIYTVQIGRKLPFVTPLRDTGVKKGSFMRGRGKNPLSNLLPPILHSHSAELLEGGKEERG